MNLAVHRVLCLVKWPRLLFILVFDGLGQEKQNHIFIYLTVPEMIWLFSYRRNNKLLCTQEVPNPVGNTLLITVKDRTIATTTTTIKS